MPDEFVPQVIDGYTQLAGPSGGQRLPGGWNGQGGFPSVWRGPNGGEFLSPPQSGDERDAGSPMKFIPFNDYLTSNEYGSGRKYSGSTDQGFDGFLNDHALAIAMLAFGGVAGGAGGAGGSEAATGAEAGLGAGWTPAYSSYTPIPGSLPGPAFGSSAEMLGLTAAGAGAGFGGSGVYDGSELGPNNASQGVPGSSRFDVGQLFQGGNPLMNLIKQAMGMPVGGAGGGMMGSMGPWMDMAQGAYGAYNAYDLKRKAQKAAEMADPQAPYRAGYARMLQELMNNPGSITSRPGYQFRMDQGNQALQRRMAAGGYNQSGNERIASIQYGQDYASNELNQEIQRLATLAGGNPGQAANMSYQGNVDAISLAGQSLNRLGYGARRLG